MAKRLIRDLNAAELEQMRQNAQQPSSQRYVDQRLADATAHAHEALGDIEDRLLDFGNPEAAAMIDAFEERIGRGKRTR